MLLLGDSASKFVTGVIKHLIVDRRRHALKTHTHHRIHIDVTIEEKKLWNFIFNISHQRYTAPCIKPNEIWLSPAPFRSLFFLVSSRSLTGLGFLSLVCCFAYFFDGRTHFILIRTFGHSDSNGVFLFLSVNCLARFPFKCKFSLQIRTARKRWRQKLNDKKHKIDTYFI